MLVRDIMTKKLESISPTFSIAEAAKIMKDQNIGSLPIIENGDNPIGFITDRDITIRCIAEDKDPHNTKVENCMTKEVVSVHEDDSLEEASKAMCDHKVRRVLVMDKNEKPVGILNLNHIASHDPDGKLINQTIHEFYDA